MDSLLAMQSYEEHRQRRESGFQSPEEESGSHYTPGRESSESSSEGDDDQDCGEKTAEKRKSKHPPPAAPKRAKTSPPASTAPAAQKPSKTSPSPSPSTQHSPPSGASNSKRSHHKKKKCPVEDCAFHGVDLRRHLAVHMKNREISENSVEKLLTIVSAGDKHRGKERARKGMKTLSSRVKKWCPVPFCSKLVINVGRHLTNPNTHDIKKGSREYQRLLLLAKQYTGSGEMDVEMVPPPPAVVEITPESEDQAGPSASVSPSPSATAPGSATPNNIPGLAAAPGPARSHSVLPLLRQTTSLARPLPQDPLAHILLLP